MEKVMTGIASVLFILVFPGMMFFSLNLLISIILISATLFLCAEPIGAYFKAVSVSEPSNYIARCVSGITENSISNKQSFYGCNCKNGCSFGNVE